MARQPKRSAFLLTLNFLLNLQIFFRILLILSSSILIVHSDGGIIISNDNDNIKKNSNLITIFNNNNNNSSSSSVIKGSGGQQPKFGDRLLPRHRQFTGPNQNQSINGSSFSSNLNKIILDSSTSNLNSFNENSAHNNNSSFSTSNSNSFNSNLDTDHLDYYFNHHHRQHPDNIDDVNKSDHYYQHLNIDSITNSNSDSVSHSNNNKNNNNGHNDNGNIHINRFSKSKSIKSISSSGHNDHNNMNSSANINSNNYSSSGSSSNNSDDNNLWWISDRKNSPNRRDHKADQHEEEIEIDDGYAAVVHDVDGVAIPVAEEQQRLRRRNDYDIDRNDLVDHHHLHHTNMNVSKADRLIEMSTEFFIIPTSTTPNPHDLNYQQQQQQHQQITPRPVLILAPRTPASTNNLSLVTPPSIISTSIHLDGLRKEPWVVPVLVLASLSMIMMAAFEIFVLFKAWRTSPSRRHLFLGQMLLLGLFACAGLGAVLTATPNVLSCATVRFGVGVAYALVFAALLVKCVFLISLNGGVYLPAPYQGLLLLFAVLIQVAIGTQWLVTQPPDIQTLTVPIGPIGSSSGSSSSSTSTSTSSGKFSMLITSSDITRIQGTTVISLCKTQFSEFLLSLIYIVFLIIFVTVLAIKSRGIRDNYREATYIGLAIGGAIPIWLGWTLCGLAVTDRHKDACLAFGLVATSATVFLVMFMPKGRQLAAMGKEGLYVEDREEQFSSLSRAGSGYSPSFFHFKPIKYGVMGHIPNSTANTGGMNGGNGGTITGGGGNTTGNSSKHQSGATLGGDRVALVAAGPPSYTRMYHYFPAHLTHPFCFYPTPPPPPPLSPPLSPLKAIGSHNTPTSAHIAQTIRYPGLFMRPDEANVYTTLEPTLSSNPNVYFQRSGGVHPGMMY